MMMQLLMILAPVLMPVRIILGCCASGNRLVQSIIRIESITHFTAVFFVRELSCSVQQFSPKDS